MKRAGRLAITIPVTLLLAPTGVVAAVASASGIVGEWFNFTLIDFSGIGILDWLAAGPGAGPGSFRNYVTFMVGGLVAAFCFFVTWILWTWAMSPSKSLIQSIEKTEDRF